jgi:hypothetical protein
MLPLQLYGFDIAKFIVFIKNELVLMIVFGFRPRLDYLIFEGIQTAYAI